MDLSYTANMICVSIYNQSLYKLYMFRPNAPLAISICNFECVGLAGSAWIEKWNLRKKCCTTNREFGLCGVCYYQIHAFRMRPKNNSRIARDGQC